MNKPTAKRQAFINEYLKDFNGTQAAIRAGYSKKTAYSQAERLLRNVEIQSALRESQEKATKKAILTLEESLEILSQIAKATSEAAGNRIAAIKQAGCFSGWEAPKEVNVTGACVILPPEDPLEKGKGLTKVHGDR